MPVQPRWGHVDLFSPRQVEVVSLMAVGFSNKQIAHRLEITLGTVKSHVHMILTKLHASNRTEAAAKLTQMDIVAGQL